MATSAGDAGRDAPAAAPYAVMPAYAATAELAIALELFADRVPERNDHGHRRALRERGNRLLLACAEAGARAPTWRRRLFYQDAWYGTFDLDHLLRSAALDGFFPQQTRTGIDIFFRMAQQALTLAAGAMADREEREREKGRK